MIRRAVRCVLDHYPKIFFACHQRHRRDPKTRRVLSAHQSSILDQLDVVDATCLTDLARHMGVTPGTMSLAVSRLIRQGYVVRARARHDGRRLDLRLSAAGVRMKSAQSVLEPERLHAVLRRLTPAERRAAVHGLALLARAAQEEMHSRSGQRRRSS
ncbi:MAG: MarR family transcriptional regulator [Acidobacteria bacterium]|nr:MarR family transcriptional regulator [Acidobacteriota bacterium]